MSLELTGSLCTGYGGLDMALDAVLGPSDLAWYAEIDPDASTVLAKHHPGVDNLGDIRAVDWTDYRSIELVDRLAAGFPCQAVSSAGLRLGEDDPRWLWPWVCRAIGLAQPTWVALENVRNLISMHGGELWRAILDDLQVLGYETVWLTVGACAVGAPHHRHRVFALARLVDDPPPARRVEVMQCGAPKSDGRILLPTPRASDGRNGGPNQGIAAGDIALSSAVQPERWGVYAEAVALWETLTRPAPEPTEPGTRGNRRLAAPFPEWMMGLPAGYLSDLVSRTAALRMAGNGAMERQAAAALAILHTELTSGEGPA